MRKKGKPLNSYVAMLLVFAMIASSGTGLNAEAAAANTVSKSGITYQIKSSTSRTATVVSAEDGLKKAVIPSTVKIGGKKYKVTAVSNGAFKNCKKLTRVTLGKNITTVGKSAFSGDKKLCRIVIKSKKLKKVSKHAFNGIKKTAKFYAHKSKTKSYTKLLGKNSVGWKKTMKIIGCWDTLGETQTDNSGITGEDSFGDTETVTKNVTTTTTTTTTIIKNNATTEKAATETESATEEAVTNTETTTEEATTEEATTETEVTTEEATTETEVTTEEATTETEVTTEEATTETEVTTEEATTEAEVTTEEATTETEGTTEEATTETETTTEEATTEEPSAQEPDVNDPMSYTYTVTPLVDGICGYYYIQTDNPDPTSFTFVDEDTDRTSGEAYLQLDTKEYVDVDYEDVTTKRVNGGYIFYGDDSDGGELHLAVMKNHVWTATDVTVTIPEIKSKVQYLVDTYTTPSMTFFEKMDAVQVGLYKLSLYIGAYVRSKEEERSTTVPYYGLSTASHADQDFYIQTPYEYDKKPMLISYLYPYILDSTGFPGMMSKVAKYLDSSVKTERDSYIHSIVNVTYDGVTRAYGGNGTGGGQGIYEDMVKYRFSFDGSSDDVAKVTSWSRIKTMIQEYGAMDVETKTHTDELTWESVADTVGTEGAYVKLQLCHADYYELYAFLYKEEDGNVKPGYISGAWFDGRYFNDYEYIEKGVTFDGDAAKADIYVKDAKIKLPTTNDGGWYSYNGKSVENISSYNQNTGVWSGYTKYCYDEDSDTWIASIYDDMYYCKRVYTYTSTSIKIENKVSKVDNAEFKAACTLTREQVEAMDVDRNTNTDPEGYYNYNRKVAPGTWETN